MKKNFNYRRRLILAGIILLTATGGVVFEEWHRAATVPAHHPPAILPAIPPETVGIESVMTGKNFEAATNLWLNPIVAFRDTEMSYANFVFLSDLRFSIADSDRLAAPNFGGSHQVPLLTAAGKDSDYTIISIGNFKANPTLTPVKAKPGDLFPTVLKPGLSGSFKF